MPAVRVMPSAPKFDPLAHFPFDPIDLLIGLVGAVLLPFVISTASIWIPGARLSRLADVVGDLAVKWSSPVIVLVMYGLVFLGGWYYFTLFLPTLAPVGSASWLVHMTIAGYCLLKGNYDFLCTVFGSSNAFQNDLNIMSRPKALPALPDGGRRYKWCKKCAAPKPPRAHHCAVCQRCVLAMDHHCPLTGNCVGYYNHKFFLIFTFDLMVGSLYGIAVTYYAFRQCVLAETLADFCEEYGRTRYTYMVGVVCSIPTCLLFTFQLHMILTNDTTVEYFGDILKSSKGLPRDNFDHGPRQNWLDHFGDASVLGVMRALLLPVAMPPLGDGIQFDRALSPLQPRSRSIWETLLILLLFVFGNVCLLDIVLHISR